MGRVAFTLSSQKINGYGRLIDLIKEDALKMIADEHSRAVAKFGAFHNAHEGWGVIREEYLELEKEIMKKQKNYNLLKMRKEAMQLGAMALRFMIDVT